MTEMGQPDTSAEAVERLAALMDDTAARGDCAGPPVCRWIAATLRALAAERDAALAVRDEAVIDDLSAFLAGLTAEERRIIAGLRDGSLVAVPHHRHMTDKMAEVIAGKANCCGGIAYDIYRAVIEHQIAAARRRRRAGDR
jgi:hypothetical protein